MLGYIVIFYFKIVCIVTRGPIFGCKSNLFDNNDYKPTVDGFEGLYISCWEYRLEILNHLISVTKF